jgi:very-short-patch-repair endonuclease
MADTEQLVSIRDRLLKERHALLDLSTRNRLLNTPLRTRNNRAIEIVDENAAEVFRLLNSGKALSFLPGVELSPEERSELDPEDHVTGGIPQPEDRTVDERGIAARHSDLRLQTRLTSEGLQKRLFDIWYDAQTLEEEQGVNILYLALGLLRWFDADNSDIIRHAPLVLLPVRLERSSAAERFKLRGRDEPPSPNLTLQAKMKTEFGLVIEDFRDEDEVDLAAYCARVTETVASKVRWEVLPDAMVLGFFSFSKFLMYRDLDPENWPTEAPIDQREAIGALLRDGFPESPPLIPDEAPLDDAISPIELHHVVDADSSQTVVIAEAAGGRSLVVKGPPGTGKSQTITNIIAAAVARGRKVLFVAEKMAALEVVHRRLQQAGLGPLTLELHSNKVSKRTVLEELKRTRDAVLRRPRNDLTVIQKLGEARSDLNAFAQRLHQPLKPSGLSPFAILGRLARAQKSSEAGTYVLANADAWSEEDVANRRALAVEVAERARAVEPLPTHTWRGAQCGALDPVERGALLRDLVNAASHLSQTKKLAAEAANALGLPQPLLVNDLDQTLAALAVFPIPADADLTTMGLPTWSADRDRLAELIESGRAYAEAWDRAEQQFNTAGLTSDLSEIRSAVVTKGKSLFRFLDGNYRAQLALLKSYLIVPLPKSQEERIATVDDAIEAQEAKKRFESRTNAGEAFGAAWKGERSAWDKLSAVLDWRAANADLPPAAWQQLGNAEDPAAIERTKEALAAVLPTLRSDLGHAFDALCLDLDRAFGSQSIAEVPLDALAARLGAWRADPEGLSAYVAFGARARALADAGAGTLVEALHDGALNHASLVQAFDNSYAEILRVALFADWPELRSFDGEAHNTQIERFRMLDKARIALAQEQIVAEHAEGRPHGAAGIGPLGVLNAEIARRRGHLPIRKLLEKAGPAIQQLKPVFMMSPLSVAQFLKPGGLNFDLLVMDEASQIEPVDALGAIARADQLVVVGDEKQLPPTAFFKKLTGDDDGEGTEDDGIVIQAKDAESILDLCLAKGVPARMLSWHYRSKHQSLIAVSNREFYDNRLFIVPSPYDAVAGMGLKFNLLKNAPYERGGSRTNPAEAKAVAEAVIQHARSHPEQSLGVATFSVAQRQTVLKELELLRRANPDTEEFFAGGGSEPFFVKNLENIQGDERDIIFISVGYGKTEQGYLAHAFGPLSGEGGERRLNVLISRAKLRCEVFANFTGADIDLERTRARGVAALKLFMTFAETGHFGLGEVSGDDFDSEFEIDVCERLQALGYDVKRQIGASGFRVDLAIGDPEKPGRFVLGLECDGAQFHSSRSARDRDRLRQQVLEDHGWIIHRVWSADWYLRPQAELKKIEDAYVAARAEWAARDDDGYKPKQAVPLTIEVSALDDDGDLITGIIGPASASFPKASPYVEASFPVMLQVDPHEAPIGRLADYVEQIVEVEGPIHIDEITTRIRILWGLGRAGNRIRAAVQHTVKRATERGTVVGGPFYTRPGQTITVRDRSTVHSQTLRRPEMLPPAEIEQAMIEIVRANYGASHDDLIQTTSRAFGFSSTSAQLRAVLADAVKKLEASDALQRKGDLLVIALG